MASNIHTLFPKGTQSRQPVPASSSGPKIRTLADLPKYQTREEQLQELVDRTLEECKRLGHSTDLNLDQIERESALVDEIEFAQQLSFKNRPETEPARMRAEQFAMAFEDGRSSTAQSHLRVVAADLCVEEIRAHVQKEKECLRACEQEMEAIKLKIGEAEKSIQVQQAQRLQLDQLAKGMVPDEVFNALQRSKSQAQALILVLSHLKTKSNNSCVTRLIESLKSLARRIDQALEANISRVCENRRITTIAVAVIAGMAVIAFRHYL